MRCLEELQAAPFLERDLSIRELDLEIRRHVSGSNEHGDLTERRSFFVQLEQPVDDEACLLLFVARRDEPRGVCSGALGPEILREAFGSARDQRIGDIEDWL